MKEDGFTLIELAIVIVIIGIISTLAISKSGGITEAARHTATQSELTSLARAIRGNPNLYESGQLASFGYVGDVGSFPSSLLDLITRPTGYTTWAGPYITDDGSSNYSKDGWGATYSYSGGTTIQSTGSGSTITKQLATTTADYTSNTVRGVIHDAKGLPPGIANNSNVIISLTHPNGVGGSITTTVSPTPTGAFAFNSIPVGTFTLQIIHNVGSDTLLLPISVLPNSIITVPTKFGVALW